MANTIAITLHLPVNEDVAEGSADDAIRTALTPLRGEAWELGVAIGLMTLNSSNQGGATARLWNALEIGFKAGLAKMPEAEQAQAERDFRAHRKSAMDRYKKHLPVAQKAADKVSP